MFEMLNGECGNQPPKDCKDKDYWVPVRNSQSHKDYDYIQVGDGGD